MDDIFEKENLKDTFVYFDNITVAEKTTANTQENVKQIRNIIESGNLTIY